MTNTHQSCGKGSLGLEATRSCHLNVFFWNLWLWCLIKWDKIHFRCFAVIMSCVWTQDEQSWQSLGLILEISSSIRFKGTVCCCSIFSKWEEFPIELLFLLFEFKNGCQRVGGDGSMSTRCESKRIWVQIQCSPNLWHSQARLQSCIRGRVKWGQVSLRQERAGRSASVRAVQPTSVCLSSL